MIGLLCLLLLPLSPSSFPFVIPLVACLSDTKRVSVPLLPLLPEHGKSNFAIKAGQQLMESVHNGIGL